MASTLCHTIRIFDSELLRAGNIAIWSERRHRVEWFQGSGRRGAERSKALLKKIGTGLQLTV